MTATDRSELTRWVAENAMGWNWVEDSQWVNETVTNFRGAWEQNHEYRQGRHFDPTTKIEHAFMLVDRMRERNAHFVMGSFPSGQTTAWFVDKIWAIGKKQNEVPHQDDPACLGSYTADTPSLAITQACRAALEAQG